MAFMDNATGAEMNAKRTRAAQAMVDLLCTLKAQNDELVAALEGIIANRDKNGTSPETYIWSIVNLSTRPAPFSLR